MHALQDHGVLEGWPCNMEATPLPLLWLGRVLDVPARRADARTRPVGHVNSRARAEAWRADEGKTSVQQLHCARTGGGSGASGSAAGAGELGISSTSSDDGSRSIDEGVKMDVHVTWTYM